MTTTTQNRIEKIKAQLPENHSPYTDKYFLRTGEVLRAEGLNPWVRAQVMIRKGPGNVYGIEEAVSILKKYSKLQEHGGIVLGLPEGAPYAPRDTVMLIEAPIQDIVELETMYLGVISAQTTKANDQRGIDLDDVRKRMASVVHAARGREVSYFGARHWRYDEDESISGAAFEGGALSSSTDIGARLIGQEGKGTTPHVLENIMSWNYGQERAVLETLLAFDKTITQKVPRIILCDYRNKEITDTLLCARALGNKLWGPRIDTCGENVGEGAIEVPSAEALENLFGKKIEIPSEEEKYWFGRGVSVSGVYAMRKALDENGYKNMHIALSSGFANPKKVEAFSHAEEILGVKVYDLLGVGQVFESRAAKMDIVAVGNTPKDYQAISKTGRSYRPNARLIPYLGGRI